jgi:hypothetical protein
MQEPKLIVLESPFSAETEEDRLTLQKYLRDCMTAFYTHGHAPIALHDVYPRLPDGKIHYDSEIVSSEFGDLPGREYALSCCRAYRNKIGCVAFCSDYHISSGMKQAYKEAIEDKIEFEIFFLRKDYTTEEKQAKIKQLIGLN